MPTPNPTSPWLARPWNCLPAILFAICSGASPLAAEHVHVERPGVITVDVLRLVRSSDFPPGQLLAMHLGAVTAQLAAAPAGPLPGQRATAPTPKPGPCPLPILPALAAMEDTTFFAVRDVPHGTVTAVNYTTGISAPWRAARAAPWQGCRWAGLW